MEYGSRVGVWRLLRILKRHDVPTTVFACARALERNPHVTRAFVEAGMDIANHGLWWEGHALLEPDVERARIEESTRLITALTGTRPVGWYSRDGVSPRSRHVLRDLGYLYDANAFNDDVPYDLMVDGARHLVLPYAGDANDARLTSMQRMATADAFAEFLEDAVRQLLLDTPRAAVLPIGLHPRIIGRPAYALALERFLERNRAHDQLWFTTQRDLARVWRSSAYPSPAGAPAGDHGTTRADAPKTGTH